MTDPDLSLVSTDDLIDELCKRHDAILIIRDREHTDDAGQMDYQSSGSMAAAIGLATWAKHELLKSD